MVNFTVMPGVAAVETRIFSYNLLTNGERSLSYGKVLGK